ncbi:MAG: hypothetical protein ACM31C_12040 [Acidobacteriota bacterium]
MILLVAWLAWLASVGAAAATYAMPFIFLATLGPIVALATWARAPATGVLRPGWRAPYRATCGVLVAASALGIASGARAAVLDASHLGNSLVAAIFLAMAILGWRALVKPSPVRIASIAPALYLGAVLFATLGGAMDLDLYWSWLAPGWPLLAIAIAAVFGAIASLFAFTPEIPEAQQLA